MSTRPLFRVLLVVVGCFAAEWAAGAAQTPTAAEPRIKVTVRMVTVNETAGNCFRLALDLDDFTRGDGPRVPPTTSVQGKSVAAWISLMQRDESTRVLVTPSLMTVNHRPATIVIGTEKDKCLTEGVRIVVQPRVAADATIKMPTHLELASPSLAKKVSRVKVIDGEEEQEIEIIRTEPTMTRFMLKETLVIPSGQTVVCYLGKISMEQRREFDACPFLARIPYINRLFRNVGYGSETQDVFVFIDAGVVTK